MLDTLRAMLQPSPGMAFDFSQAGWKAVATCSRTSPKQRIEMENEASNFMAQVQTQLNELESAPALSVAEQDIVESFQEQEFSARRCAERIAEERGPK